MSFITCPEIIYLAHKGGWEFSRVQASLVTLTILGVGGTSGSSSSALVTSSTIASSASEGTASGSGSGISGIDVDGSSLSSGTSSVHFSKRYIGNVDEKAECL
jgi:hypothetical protein